MLYSLRFFSHNLLLLSNRSALCTRKSDRSKPVGTPQCITTITCHVCSLSSTLPLRCNNTCHVDQPWYLEQPTVGLWSNTVSTLSSMCFTAVTTYFRTAQILRWFVCFVNSWTSFAWQHCVFGVLLALYKSGGIVLEQPLGRFHPMWVVLFLPHRFFVTPAGSSSMSNKTPFRTSD